MRSGDLADDLLRAYATDDRVTRFLIESLPDEAWRAKPPGPKGRTIAAIVSHMHNNRLMWLKMTGRRSKLPAQLNRHTVTRARALAALPKSRDAMLAALGHDLRSGTVKNAPPDAAHFFAYQIAHEAHHRGQILMLLGQLGIDMPDQVRRGVWQYNMRHREAEEGR